MNNKKKVAVALINLLALIPASQSIAADTHAQVDTQITSGDWGSLGVESLTGAADMEVSYNPYSNFGCANIGCLDNVQKFEDI